jgi:hypothetical protein
MDIVLTSLLLGTYLVNTWYILGTCLSLNLTFCFVLAENVLVLDGKTEIFPPEIPEKAELVPHNLNVLAAHRFNVLTGCHNLPGYADQPNQKQHHSFALAESGISGNWPSSPATTS